MNEEEQKQYEEKMGSPEMEYLQYQMEHPEINIPHSPSVTVEEGHDLHKGILPANERPRVSPVQESREVNGWWQKNFLDAGTLEGLGDLSLMIPTVSGIVKLAVQQGEQSQWEKMTTELKTGIEKAIKEIEEKQAKMGLLDSEAGFIAGLRHVAKEAGINLTTEE